MRLPLKIDAHKLRGEITALPDSLWGSTGGRVGVHKVSEALFLRGFAPAEGDKPIADRPALNLMPYLRFIIEQVLPAVPLRCLLARLPAGGVHSAPRRSRALFFEDVADTCACRDERIGAYDRGRTLLVDAARRNLGSE